MRRLSNFHSPQRLVVRLGLATVLLLVIPAYHSCCAEESTPVRPAADAPQPLSPEDSAKCIRLPEGFRIELVASEPVVTEPSCLAFDEKGRLFVCELHGYNVEGEIDVAELNKTGKLDKEVRRIRWEIQGGKIAEQAKIKQYGVVKMLRDNTGDGVMDEAVVWADDLPPCYGVIPANGGIIVTCAPDIVFFADRDGDGKPDVRETLFTGFDVEVMERGVNNPRWGVDNWIYVGSGGRGGNITGPHLKQPVKLGNTDFRMKPDGTAIEPVNGSVGTFGMTINRIGDRFPASGGRPANYALPLPYRYLARNPHVATPGTTLSAVDYNRGFRISAPHPWRVRRRKDPNWIKFYGDRETNSNYFSGGCSNEYYGDQLFPVDYLGNLFYCEPSLNIVHRCVIERDGAKYRGRRHEANQEVEWLASTDQWFRPMNLRTGPYGELYIVDMYREIIEDYSAIPRFLQQQYGLGKGRDRGRIWRLLPKDEATPRSAPNLTNYGTQQLVAVACQGRSRWMRNTARRLLIERAAPNATALIASQLKSYAATINYGQKHSVADAKINLLYCLAGLQTLNHVHVADLIQDADFAVRVHALRLAESLASDHKPLSQQIAQAVFDEDASVRLQAALSLGETYFGKLDFAKQRRPSHPLFQLAKKHGKEPWVDTAILSSSRHISTQLIQDILTAEGGLNDATLPLLRPLAATTASERQLRELSHLIELLEIAPPTAQAACLQGIIDGLPQNGPTLRLDDAAATRLLLWTSNANEEVRRLAGELALRLVVRRTDTLTDMTRAATQVAADAKRTVAIRKRAIRSLAGAPFEQLATLAGLLTPVTPPAIQVEVVSALDSSSDSKVTDVLLTPWDGYSPTMRNSVLKAIFARESRLPGLISAVNENKIHPNAFSASQRESLLNNRNANVAGQAKRWFSSGPTGAVTLEQLQKYKSALTNTRDPKQGSLVFAKHCQACHRLGDLGHEVGPSLSTIANKPDEVVLLDILNPSDRIEPDYRSYNVVTKDGRNYIGVLRSETPTSINLAMEKGETRVVLRKDVDQMRASDVSMMPSDLHASIPPNELAHLLAYIRKSLAADKQ